jgi:hypothetical protein
MCLHRTFVDIEIYHACLVGSPMKHGIAGTSGVLGGTFGSSFGQSGAASHVCLDQTIIRCL